LRGDDQLEIVLIDFGEKQSKTFAPKLKTPDKFLRVCFLLSTRINHIEYVTSQTGKRKHTVLTAGTFRAEVDTCRKKKSPVSGEANGAVNLSRFNG
jgi:hypothetical protein